MSDYTPADTFDDVATVLSTRTQLDELLLSALSAPGLDSPQTTALGSFLRDGALERGSGALDRLRASLPQGADR